MSHLAEILCVLALQVTPAAANDDPWVAPEDDSYATGVQQGNPDTATGHPTNTAQPLGTYHQEPACDGVCSGIRTCPDGTIQTHSWFVLPNGDVSANSYWCPSDGGAPAVTDDVVAIAFRRIPLPPSTFSIQPPGGRTLVNFETNFFTEERTLNRTVRLLGRRVDLRIEAHSYMWRFGDGETVTTDKPGAPYPRLQITHNYLQTGDYGPALDITWVADYRVNGGAWQPVPGSVTIEGQPTDLTAIEARPTLVGYGG